MIQFACASCGSQLRVPPSAAGKLARCPRCESHQRVPAPPPAYEVVDPEPAPPSGPESAAEAALIRACRARLGAPPRTVRAAAADACRLRLSPGLDASFRKNNDPLLRVITDLEALLGRGTLVWGHLVQANQILFDPENDRTAPANVLYSTDPYFDGRADLLGAFARDIFAQKGTLPGGHELATFVRAVTDEYLRVMRRELPLSYTGGRPVYFATCLIQPDHLPDNHISRSEFPLLVNFDETESVMVLPSRFWPPELIAQWRSGPKRAARVRCPFCHQYVDPDEYPAHRAEHAKLRPDGQQTDYMTLPEEDREHGDLAGVPTVYRHTACGSATRMPDEIVRSYLKNPYLYSADQTFCCGCGTHVPLRECVWTETGEDLQSYTNTLRAAKPELNPNPKPSAPPDPAAAVRRYREAAERGDATAMNNLGFAYARGEGVRKDDAEAARWYRKAADLGDAMAMTNLGLACENGKGVPVDLAQAVRWYRKAAALGDVRGMSSLGLALATGRGVPVDLAESIKWLRRAADLGSPVAMCNLGYSYEHGEGVRKDDTEAAKWYRKGADLGHMQSMSSLGLMLATGRGVPVNHAEAVKWLRRAADLGSPVAMCNLGYSYEHGEGVSKDRAQAVKWYRKAAEQGNKSAADALARLGY